VREQIQLREVLAEVLAAVEVLPRAARIGRDQPLGAATPKQLREIGQLLERTQIFDATTLELPPQIAQWARTSTKQERAGIKVQLRLRAGYGGMDRVMVTGAKGNDNPHFGALLDVESAAPGQVYLFDTGYCKLATYDQIREHGCELVTVLHKSITVEVVEERVVETPVTAQGSVIHSDRLVHLGTGDTRSRYLWRVIDATDTQGRRRTILSSLLAEPAERITQLRTYRWTIEIVFRWLKRGLQLDELISVSPAGIELQVDEEDDKFRSHAGGFFPHSQKGRLTTLPDHPFWIFDPVDKVIEIRGNDIAETLENVWHRSSFQAEKPLRDGETALEAVSRPFFALITFPNRHFALLSSGP